MAASIRWERDEWGPYFRCLADRLGLRDWEFRIDDGPPENPGALAHCCSTEGRRRSRIDLSDAFLRATEEEQRHAAVHEVLHAHHAHEYHLLGKMLGDEQYRIYILAHEYAHDAAAKAVAGFLPLPSEILSPIRQDELPNSPA